MFYYPPPPPISGESQFNSTRSNNPCCSARPVPAFPRRPEQFAQRFFWDLNRELRLFLIAQLSLTPWKSRVTELRPSLDLQQCLWEWNSAQNTTDEADISPEPGACTRIQQDPLLFLGSKRTTRTRDPPLPSCPSQCSPSPGDGSCWTMNSWNIPAGKGPTRTCTGHPKT